MTIAGESDCNRDVHRLHSPRGPRLLRRLEGTHGEEGGGEEREERAEEETEGGGGRVWAG